MKSKLKSKTEGFTIIEVLIVLAIAGLIMLIVFLAVPTLQRNSRNTQRNNDASLVLAAVNECVNNRNGNVPDCIDNTSSGELQNFLDTSKLRQLTTVGESDNHPSGLESVNLADNSSCKDDGADREGGSTRQFVALYNVETSSGGNANRCVEG